MDKKILKKSFNSLGGYMLIQNLVLYATSIILVIAVLLVAVSINSHHIGTFNYRSFLEKISTSGWIMIVSVLMAFLPVLWFRGNEFFTHDIITKRKSINIKVVFVAILAILITNFTSGLINVIVEFIVKLLGLSLDKVSESLNFTVTPSMIFYACVIAPVMEESLYRGIVLRYLEKYGRVFAIVISALMFGLMHGNLIQTPGAILAGLVLGYLASEYSLKLSILAHAFNNIFAVVVTLLSGKGSNMIVNILVGLFMMMVILVAITLAIIYLVSKNREIKDWIRNNRTQKGVYKYFFSSVTIIIYLIINILIIVINIR